MTHLAVGVLTLDQLLEDLLIVGINAAPSLTAAPASAADDPDVMLIASPPLDEHGRRSLRALIHDSSADRPRPAVLLIQKVTDQQALYAREHGLGECVSWSRTSVRELGETIRTAREGYCWDSASTLVSVLQGIHDLRGSRSARDLFSAQETTILQLLAEGLGTQEIAGRLNYSERTVKSMITRMSARHSLVNRPQLVAFAYRNGVL
jgi:DNA-binding NarL/FixJ family response regulator